MNQRELFAHDELGPRFKMKDMAEIIGEPPEALRHLVQRRYVENRGVIGGGPTAHQLFALADMATAKLVRLLNLIGVTASDVLYAANHACYHWQHGIQGNFAHPITDLIADAAKVQAQGIHREYWFRLDLNFEKGQRQTNAILYSSDDPVMSSSLPVGVILINLTETIQKLAGILREHVAREAATKH